MLESVENKAFFFQSLHGTLPCHNYFLSLLKLPWTFLLLKECEKITYLAWAF